MCSSNLGPGWNISPQGLNLISENNTITDKNILLKNTLNADLKEIGLPVLTKELTKSHISQLVLQIQKIRNVSAPKANEESQAAPRMLKLILTDGESYAQAIETSTIPGISREKTPPGSKLLLINVRILNGFLILNQENTKLLGGKVPHLLEKWELAKSVQHCSRPTASVDGPPAWVNFGCKISASGDEFRPLEHRPKDQSKENSEFEALRQGAIAEATTGAVKKVFGGGIKQPVQNNYRIDNNRGRNDGKPFNKSKKELRGGKDKELDDRPQKPSDKVSLFDFLEDKLNITESTSVAKPKNEENHHNNFTKSAFDNKKNLYNNNDKNYSNQRNNYPKKEYNNYNDRKFNSPRDSSFNTPRDSSFNTLRDSSFNKDLTGTRPREQYKSQDHFNSNKYDLPREASFNKDSIGNKKEPYKNHEHYNSNKYDTSRESHNNRDSALSKGDPNKNQDNFVSNKRQYGKSENTQSYNQTNQNKDTNRFSRNEKERINDSWHYRAPDKVNSPVQNVNAPVSNLTDSMGKMSVNSEFASRSLRQHLNLDIRKPPPTQTPQNSIQNSIQTNQSSDSKRWNVGDDCFAKYWEDEKFYPAKITAFTDTTYVVQFRDYGNIEEVLKTDCMPSRGQDKGDDKRQYKGTLKFRRSPRKFTSS